MLITFEGFAREAEPRGLDTLLYSLVATWKQSVDLSCAEYAVFCRTLTQMLAGLMNSI